jgi:Domain of unknown function (DUF6798)
MKFKKTWQGIAIFIITTSLFALAYNQSPLYSSNQYQYFLHGLARAGVGTLSEDWLANTVDPTPLFSLLVEFIARIHAEGLFYLLYALLMGIYLFSLICIVETIFPVRKSPRTFLVFLTGIILLHSAGLRYLLTKVPGADWSYLFDGGVAGQRLLGPVFQPSVFGVFLLLSICFYLHRKPIYASLSAVFAATIHPTYLMGSAVLILAYLVDMFFFEHRKQRALGVGLFALAVTSPILVYTFTHFVGGSPGIAERAREILVNIRIPHHAQIAVWFDASVIIKLALLGTALNLVRRNRLFLLIALPLGISILLTLVQFISGNLTLAVLFPWRLSAWLVPIALSLIVGKLSILITTSLPAGWRRVLDVVSLGLIVLAVFIGLSRTWLEAKKAAQSPELPVEKYIAVHHQPGEVYLIPVKMYDFRLNTGAPVYGDFYYMPLQNNEIIEWYSRYLNAKHFYERADCKLLHDLSGQGVTHVVLPAEFPMNCPSVLAPIYNDEFYGLFLLHGNQ